MTKQKIDFVITWVNGADSRWKQEKNNCMKQFCLISETDDRTERYRDWGILPYWFRGVEMFAPWVKKNPFCYMGTFA